MISSEIVVNCKVVDLSFFHLRSFVQFENFEFQNLRASSRILGPYMVSNKKSSTTKLSIASRSTTLI